MTELGEFAMFLAVGGGMLGLTLGPIGRALARRLEGRRQPGEDFLADLEARVAELEAARQHIAELEERLDFTERLLARLGSGDGEAQSPRGAVTPFEGQG